MLGQPNSAAFSMAGSKITHYVDQLADAEAQAAAHKKANRYPAEDATVLRLAERVEQLEARVAELERNRPTFSG
jgi:uncharacterized protein YceH (UPF0502 family)